MNKRIILLAGLAILATIIACAPASHDLARLAGKLGEPAGFLKGLWHGFIMLFTFIISLFKDNITVYEIHNNGGWYNFGFVLGAMIFFGGGGHGSSRNR